MAGLVPAIHVFLSARTKDVDARDKPGHDGGENGAPSWHSTLPHLIFAPRALHGFQPPLP